MSSRLTPDILPSEPRTGQSPDATPTPAPESPPAGLDPQVRQRLSSGRPRKGSSGGRLLVTGLVAVVAAVAASAATVVVTLNVMKPDVPRPDTAVPTPAVVEATPEPTPEIAPVPQPALASPEVVPSPDIETPITPAESPEVAVAEPVDDGVPGADYNQIAQDLNEVAAAVERLNRKLLERTQAREAAANPAATQPATQPASPE